VLSQFVVLDLSSGGGGNANYIIIITIISVLELVAGDGRWVNRL